MSSVVRVNPIACEGRGLCAELLPERIRLDDWGYPIVDPRPIPAELEAHARRAVDACPMLALSLLRGRPEIASAPTSGRAAASQPRARRPQGAPQRRA
jgi:ferredoxin